jgi:hypothetical protein
LCSKDCKKPIIKKYDCDNGICVEKDDGQYDSLDLCSKDCKKPIIKKYDCDNGICVEKDDGQYDSLDLCSKDCKKPKTTFPILKYTIFGVIFLLLIFILKYYKLIK